MAITHLFASTVADSTDATLVRPSNWNADHTGTLSSTQGGTGIANNIAATLTRNGSFALGLTLTAASTVTLPTSGTILNSTSVALSTITLTAAGLVAGGGTLVTDRTFTVTAASDAQTITGTVTTVAVTPANVAASRNTFGGLSNYLFCD